jgi:glucose uptake protein GlcU
MSKYGLYPFVVRMSFCGAVIAILAGIDILQDGELSQMMSTVIVGAGILSILFADRFHTLRKMNKEANNE